MTIDLINGFSVMLYNVRQSPIADHDGDLAKMFTVMIKQLHDSSSLQPNIVAMNFGMMQADEGEMVDLTTHSVYTTIGGK